MKALFAAVCVCLFPCALSPASAGVVQVIQGFEVTYPKGKIGGSSSQGLPAQYVAVPPAREYYLDFQVNFHADWEWVKGGKLAGGLVGGKHTSGCASIVPDGWSARFTFGSAGSAHIYLYDQNRRSGCGDTYVLEGSRMPKQAWSRLTERVVVNTPGKRDGLIEAWFNGKKLLTIGNLALRGNVGPNVALIDNVSLQTFYGGSSSSWAPSRDTHASYSNFYVRDDAPDFTKSFEEGYASTAVLPRAGREAPRVTRSLARLGNGQVTLPGGIPTLVLDASGRRLGLRPQGAGILLIRSEAAAPGR